MHSFLLRLMLGLGVIAAGMTYRAEPAEARGGRFVGGLVVGAIVGGIIANEISRRRYRKRYYYDGYHAYRPYPRHYYYRGW